MSGPDQKAEVPESRNLDAYTRVYLDIDRILLHIIRYSQFLNVYTCI